MCLNRFCPRLSRAVFRHSLTVMSITASHCHIFRWNAWNVLLLNTIHLCGMIPKYVWAENWNYVSTLHELCNAFFSVTLPLMHFKTTCSSLNAFLAKVTTFSRNRRCKWNSYDLIIATKHLQKTASFQEALGEKEVRSVYLITYSQANLDLFPTWEEFVSEVVKSSAKCNANILQWCCSCESHKKSGKHYHLSVKLGRN